MEKKQQITFGTSYNQVTEEKKKDTKKKVLAADGSFVGQWVSPELVNAASNLNTSLFGGIAQIISSANNKSTTNTLNINKTTEEKKTNVTLKWVGIVGGIATVLTVALVIIFRKRD